MKRLIVLTLTLGLFCCAQSPALGQNSGEQPKQQPTEASAEEAEKEKAEREKNAFRLLDQVIDDAQSLRLAENRVRVQIGAADMLWDRNQGRARSLFQMVSRLPSSRRSTFFRSALASIERIGTGGSLSRPRGRESFGMR